MNILNLSTLTNCLFLQKHLPVFVGTCTKRVAFPPQGGAMAGGHGAFCKHGEADATGRDGGARKIWLGEATLDLPPPPQVTVKQQGFFLHF